MPTYEDLLTQIRPLMRRLSNWAGYSLAQDGDGWVLTMYVLPGVESLPIEFNLLPLRIRREPMGQFSVVPRPPAHPVNAPLTLTGAPAGTIGSPVSVRSVTGVIRGSIGAYVRNEDGVWLLSANHVLACNGRNLPLADPNHGVYLGARRVSRTIVFRELRPHGNQADAAACLLVDPTPGFVAPWPQGWARNPTPFTPTAATRVKVSVNGADAFGIVVSASLDGLRVSMGAGTFPCSLDNVEFSGGILVRADDDQLGRPGNSGGLVVTADAASHPVGLITGRNAAGFVVVSPLAKALADLGLPGQLMV